MMEEKEFDNIFKQKLDDQPFPFDESNWDLAEALIDEERKKEKRRRWFLIYFSGILSGALVMFLLMLDFSEVDFTNDAKDKRNTYDESHNIIVLQAYRLKNNSSAPSDSLIINEDLIVESHHQTSDPILSTNPENSAQTNQQLYKSNQNTNSNKQTNQSLNNQLITNNQTDKSHRIDSTNITSDNTKIHITSDSLRNSPNNVFLSDSNVSINDETQDSSTNLVHTISMAESTVASIDSVSTDASIDSDSTLVIMDSLATNIIENLEKFKPLIHLGVFGGGTFTLGNNYNDTISGRGFSPATGINLEYHFKEKWSINAALLYHYSGLLNYHFNEGISHHPGFGLNDSVIVYKLQRLHYFNLPIQVLFYLGSKNTLGTGINFSFTGFSVSSIQKSIITNSGTTLISDSKGFNYLNGYKRFDAMLNLNYRRKFTERIWWQTDFNFGLIDFIENNSFTNSTVNFDRNIYVQTGIVFNF